ncbi:MAG: molecular chaperone TorD family protein [Eggerthella lenta]
MGRRGRRGAAAFVREPPLHGGRALHALLRPGRPEGTNEPLDHVATECELLERLALRAAGAPASEGAPDGAGLPGGSPEAAYERFLSGHAQAWMPAFAERLASESRHPFYRAAAAYLGALVG